MKKQKTDNNTLQVLEQREVSALNSWVKEFQKERTGKKDSVRSHDMGGHMELREGNPDNLIGPSEEKVQELLEDCGIKLGIHYVSR